MFLAVRFRMVRLEKITIKLTYIMYNVLRITYLFLIGSNKNFFYSQQYFVVWTMRDCYSGKIQEIR